MCAQELLVLDCQCLHQRAIGLDKFLDPFVLELPGNVREGNAQALDVSQDAVRLLQILLNGIADHPPVVCNGGTLFLDSRVVEFWGSCFSSAKTTPGGLQHFQRSTTL